MGRPLSFDGKKQKSIKKAHRLAEAFAKHRGQEFLETFLKTSSIPAWLFSLSHSLEVTGKDLVEILQTLLEKAKAQGDELTAHKLETKIQDIGLLIEQSPKDDAEILTDLKADPEVDLHFGMALALSYAMGFLACENGDTLKTLYVPKEHADEPSQLILPRLE